MAIGTKLQTLSLIAIGPLLGYSAATIDITDKASAAITTGAVQTPASQDNSAKSPAARARSLESNCWRWRTATRPSPLKRSRTAKSRTSSSSSATISARRM